MQTPAAAAPSCVHAQQGADLLHRLPAELLRLLWAALGPSPDLRTSRFGQLHTSRFGLTDDQLALRRTCKAANRATQAFVTSLAVVIVLEPDEDTLQLAVRDGLAQLASFPAAAELQQLHWDQAYTSDRGMEALPGFFQGAGDRLSNVALFTCSSSADAPITGANICSIVKSLPQLQCLELSGASAAGTDLQPLEQLRGLQELTLYNVCRAGSGKVLAKLSSLTRLSLCAEPSAGSLQLEDVMPHLQGLVSLRTLDLELGSSTVGVDSPPAGLYNHFARLSQLTSLRILSADVTLSAADISSLDGAAQLRSLCLPRVAINEDAVWLLARLPLLAELTARSLEAFCDMLNISGDATSWRKVVVHSISCMQLTSLPWNGGSTQLSFSKCSRWLGGGCVCTLDHQDEEWATSRVQECAQILSQIYRDGGSPLVLHLAWWGVPAFPSHQVLAALAPLAALPAGLHLELDGFWDLDKQLVQQLAEHVPNLRGLVVQGQGDSFVEFAAAVATSLPKVTAFMLMANEEPPQLVQSALLALAVTRATSGLSLSIRAWSGMTEEQQSCFNEVAAANWRGAGGRGKVKVSSWIRW